LALSRHAKRNAVILLLASLAAAVVLASGLGNLQLGGGSPFPGAAVRPGETPPAAVARALPAEESLPLFRGILATVLLALVLVLLLRIATLANIRSILGVVLALAAIAILLAIIPPLPPGQRVSLPAEAAPADDSSFEYATAPLPKPPPAFVWLSAVAGIAGVTSVAVLALRHRRTAASMPDQLRQEAEKAVEALEAGADSTNVIVRCYLQMARLIQEERGLAREHSMTVREFESALESIALPPKPLRQLRTLFEAVRYGDRKFSAEEEQLASQSLREIVGSLRGTA